MIDAIIYTFVLLFALILLAIYDIKAFRLPNALTFSLIVAGFCISYALGGIANLFTSVAAAITGFISLWAVAAVYLIRRGKSGLGLGDAKLFAAVGAWLGPFYLAPAVAIASLAALSYVAARAGVIGKQTINDAVPFGPFIAIAFFGLWCFKTFGGA